MSFAPGEVGEAFSFNGQGSYIDVPYETDTDIGQSQNGFTIDCWINPAQVATGMPVLEWTDPRVGRFRYGFGLHIWVSPPPASASYPAPGSNT